jgi:hypothetical protein
MSHALPWESGIGGGGGAPVPAFNPLDDPDLVALWIAKDASDDGTTLTLPDRSPNGFALAATGGSGRPSISATGFAGQQAIDFSSLASGWVPLQSAAIGAALNTRQQMTVINLLGAVASPAAAFIMRYGASAAGDWYWRHTVPNVGQHDVNWFNSTATTYQTTMRCEPGSLPVCVAATFDGSLSSNKIGGVWRDGDWAMPGTYPANGAPTTTVGNKTLYVGANNTGTSPLKQPWGGAAIVRRVLSPSEIAQWTEWMRSQYSMGEPRRILFVGDSITAQASGYRRRIWDLYAADGAQPPGKHQPIGGVGLGATYLQNYHDGVSGSRVATCTTRMATTLANPSAYDPHVVCLLAGVNNIILDSDSAADVAAEWEAFCTAVYDLRPNVKIKLISLINNSTGSIIQDANALGPAAVANAIAARPGMDAEWIDSIYTVPLSDGTHPTTGSGGGYELMGDAYYPLVMGW